MKAKKVREKTEAEFDELKKLAEEKNKKNGKTLEEPTEAEPQFNLGEGDY